MTPTLYMVMLLGLLVTASGLRCPKCLPWQGNCKGKVEMCVPGQNACVVQQLRLTSVMENALRVGCRKCEVLPSDTEAGFSVTSTCCFTDLCKAIDMSLPSLALGPPCQSCVGSATTCGPNSPTVTCGDPRGQCVQISRRLLPGEKGDTMYKACGWQGPSEELLAIAAGPDLAYVHVQRCRGAGCNNGSFAEVPRGKPNGKLCYTCRDTGAGECNRRQMPTMSCTGAMDQCVKVRSTDWNKPAILLRGCGTPNLCGPLQPRGRLLLPFERKVHCCSGNHCNYEAPLPASRARPPAAPGTAAAGGAWS
ncbi:urokinase plasminogen activator surface receptor isoform X3 [Alligator mississippiensis]|uniref:Urokinase plasminogen activator surface receptor-like n=1 Tax=Alligator mississippiensis TaxID=8496 RepID=A0A151NRP2_ALLMI|nr:urokinase plasminogen activator surface receptor isoform X3 [Alligator mississippiensis]KYO39370.1 urokinase plasminogen activator surface receptor-like [Alligator mississippiensis]